MPAEPQQLPSPISSDSIDSLSSQLRDVVNQPRIRTRLEASDGRFWQAASALDLLGDTEFAIAAYFEGTRGGEAHKGERYLRMYGLLNAFVLQQDAANNLSQALGFVPTFAAYPELNEVRSVRIAAAGHTSRRDRQVSEPTFYFIHRYTLSGGGFQMATASESGQYNTETVNLHYLGELQRAGMRHFLADQLSQARREEMEHRMEFADQSLAQLLEGRHYEFEKVSSTGRGGSPVDIAMAPGALSVLRSAMESVRAALEARGLAVTSYPGIEASWSTIEECLSRIDRYFADPEGSNLDAFEAFAVSSLLRASWEELRAMAADLDGEYRATEGSIHVRDAPRDAEDQF